MQLRRCLPCAGCRGHEWQRAQKVCNASVLGRQQWKPRDDAQHDLISQGYVQAGELWEDMLPAADMHGVAY